MYDLFSELGIITGVALVFSGILVRLKQPLIIAYILTGIILGPTLLGVTKSQDSIAVFASMGVIFLLFMVGLGLNPKIIKGVGKVSLLTGLGQLVFTSLGGFFLSRWLGFGVVTAFYVSIALTFSSTIIIMKILTDKDALDSVYGRISIGFLIVQDIAAMLLLAFTTSFSRGEIKLEHFVGQLLIKTILAALIVYILGHFLIPRVLKQVAKSQEYLLLFSIGWCLIAAIIFHALDFSMEIGALIAGISLASSPFRFEIASKLKPLRDFFIFLFFIMLGTQMVFTNFSGMLVPILAFSLFILVGNPLVVMVIMGVLGYTRKNGFLAGLTVAQISEFSLIYIALGVSLGHIENEILSLVTAVGLITIAGSTYLMIYANSYYRYIAKYLKVFERKGPKKDRVDQKGDGRYEAVLFGYNRMGRSIYNALKEMKVKTLIVDYNPEVIRGLAERGIDSQYGDISDMELIDELNLCRSKMIISTLKDYDTNALFIKKVREKNKGVIIIAVANEEKEGLSLYNKGASYVVLPHHLGGFHASEMIKQFGFDQDSFIKEMESHIKKIYTSDSTVLKSP